MFLLCPKALSKNSSGTGEINLASLVSGDFEALEVVDDANTSGSDQLYGEWVLTFMRFITRQISTLNGEEFTFSEFGRMDAKTFNQIEPPEVRNLVIKFVNRFYLVWVRSIDIVAADAIPSLRDFCTDCEIEGTWTPMEGQDREFTCSEDCDSFCDHSLEARIEATDFHYDYLEDLFLAFLQTEGFGGVSLAGWSLPPCPVHFSSEIPFGPFGLCETVPKVGGLEEASFVFNLGQA